MTEPTPLPLPEPDEKWKTIALILLPLTGILLVGLSIYLVRPQKPGVVTIVYAENQPGAEEVNLGGVTDATAPGVRIEPRLGYRYRVFVEEESEDQTSGIARIAGRATFIPGARRGQTVLADVTRVRERVIDAVLVRVLSQVDLPPASPRPAARSSAPARTTYTPPDGDRAAHVVPGAEMDVVIAEKSSRYPDTDGVARVNGLVVFVPGVPTVGERVRVRITQRRERSATAEPIGPATAP